MTRLRLKTRRYWCVECKCYFQAGNPLCPQCGWQGRLAPIGDDEPPLSRSIETMQADKEDTDTYEAADNAALAEAGL